MSRSESTATVSIRSSKVLKALVRLNDAYGKRLQAFDSKVQNVSCSLRKRLQVFDSNTGNRFQNRFEAVASVSPTSRKGQEIVLDAAKSFLD